MILNNLKKSGEQILCRLGGSILSGFIPFWCSSFDVAIAYQNPIVDPAFMTDQKKRIFIFWHEYISLYLYMRKNCNISMLLSKHRDADILEMLAHLFGFGTVRGSTNRGGIEAIRQMMLKGQSHHLTITPDGPRGPRRKMAPGAIYLASRLKMPLVLVGIGYDHPRRLKSWDRFALPKYGTRARVVASDDIYIPENIDREKIQFYCQKIEKQLTFLTEQAENWAQSGDFYEGQSDMIAGPKCSVMYQVNIK